MSEGSANAGAADLDARRLEDLERTTREYAQYSSQSFGLAGLVAGALLVLRIALTLNGVVRWDNVLLIMGTMAWLVALRLARRAYQRRGAVAAAEAPRTRRWFVLVPVYLAVVVQVIGVPQNKPETGDGPLYRCAHVAMVAVLPGLFAVAWRTLRGLLDSIFVIAMIFPAGLDASSGYQTRSPEAWVRWSIGSVVWASCAIGAVVLGLTQHRAFRRLESRMALLREHVR